MTNTLKWLGTFRPSYNVFRGRYMGSRRVYMARILYNYHKPSINNGFLDWNVNKYGDFFVKYAHFLLDIYYRYDIIKYDFN